MELKPFETAAYSRRLTQKVNTSSSVISRILEAKSKVIAVIIGVVLVRGMWALDFQPSRLNGNVLTPSRLFVALTLMLIILTPRLKRKAAGSGVPESRKVPESTKPTPAPISVLPMNGLGPASPAGASLGFQSPASFSSVVPGVQKLPYNFIAGLAPVPSRVESHVSNTSGSYSRQHAPAPFVDDIYSQPRHEFLPVLSTWARSLDDNLINPYILKSVVSRLQESDQQLLTAFHAYSIRLVPKWSDSQERGVVYLSDRFLPAPLSENQQVNAVWQRRLSLEKMFRIPGFSPEYRDYVVQRITTWATKGGLRYTYRPDMRPDENGPSDSHIIVHLIFSALEEHVGIPFRDRFVLSSGSATVSSAIGGMMDDFQSLFSAKGSDGSGGHLNKIVWLEQSSNPRQPLHFNVATNQRVYGIPSGGTNVQEALCLFFHLLKKLSPTHLWMQFPADIRAVFEAATSSTGSGGDPAGVLGNNLYSSLLGHNGDHTKAQPAALPDVGLYRGF